MPCDPSRMSMFLISPFMCLSTLVMLETGLPALQMMKQGQQESGKFSMHLVAIIFTNLTCPNRFATSGRCWLISRQNSLLVSQRCSTTKDSGSASVTSLRYSSLEISSTCPYFSFVALTWISFMRCAMYCRVKSSSKSRSSSSSLIFSTVMRSSLFSSLFSSSLRACMASCSSARVVFFSLGRQLPCWTCRSNHSVDTPFAIIRVLFIAVNKQASNSDGAV